MSGMKNIVSIAQLGLAWGLKEIRALLSSRSDLKQDVKVVFMKIEGLQKTTANRITSSLASKIKPNAKFVEFETVYNPEEMVGQRYPVLNWPYIEGLRLDEAMHPLTTVVTGLYGKPLPNQNGAPLRIFIPWKYGFKSAKAIVKIKLTEKMPNTAWKNASPREYGFYSNVNPEVDHPRWSQATERVIGESILAPRIKTLMFNGYGDEVAHLYSGMDLKKNY